jgi:hypothetical protein
MAGDSSVLSTLHAMHSRDIMGVIEMISDTYPVDKLVAVPVGAHFTQPNGAFHLPNPSSILNYSQARIIEMVSDPKFDARDIGTKNVKQLEVKLLRGFDGGDISVYNMRVAMDGKQDLRLFLRSIRHVITCIFGDEAFADSLVFTFHPTFDEDGNRTFGSFMGSAWCQVHAHSIGSGLVLLAFAIFIDKSYTRVNVPVKPAFCE